MRISDWSSDVCSSDLLDEKVNVVVLDFDDDKKRIALGLKQLTAHPWESLDEAIQPGSHVKGKIVTVADYGAFMEIIPGVEGLIHVRSEESRVGKECVSTCRSRWSPYH